MLINEFEEEDDDDDVNPFANIYGRNYINSKKLFSKLFGATACMYEVGGIDVEKAIPQFTATFADEIMHEFMYKTYNGAKKSFHNHLSVYPLKSNVLVAFERMGCLILFKEKEQNKIEKYFDFILKHKRKERTNNCEVNLITQAMHGLDLSRIEVNKTRLDLKLHYEDDFIEIDNIIRKRLNKKNDKGIVLLHGLPGTGKTTYLRHIIGKIKKKVLFVPPGIAANMTNPDFVNILIENPNSVLIIEDAEHIITDRKESGNSAVSNLLNVSDGLLADCLNTQIICTFNMPLTSVDDALLRKGRLIAKYEFKKLSVIKAQQLSKHLGFDAEITEPMSVAEIYNQHERDFDVKRKRMGFAMNKER